MLDTMYGYGFYVKEDGEKHYGLINKVQVKQEANLRKITITIGVDSNGYMVAPMYFDLLYGEFKPIIKDNLDNLVKGNKAFYSVIGDFALIAHGTVTIDINTGMIVKDTVGFYVQDKVVPSYKNKKNANGEILPVVICKKVTDAKYNTELHTFLVNNELLLSYKNHFLQAFTSNITDKRSLIENLL